MGYKIIYTIGREFDEEFSMKGYRSDLLLMDSNGNYFELNYVEPEVILNSFNQSSIYYIENNLILVHDLSFETIIASVYELERRLFVDNWQPLTIEQLEKYYSPREKWEIYEIKNDHE